MKKNTLVCLAFWLASSFPNLTLAQGIYVSAVTKELYRLDLNNCNVEFVTNIQHTVNDISFHPNGKLYGIGPFGNFFEIDLVTGAVYNIHKFTGQVYNSLTVHSNGRIYAAGSEGHLWSYELNSNQETYHGDFGFSAAGDLTFYKGKLYAAVLGNNIIAIDINHPPNSQIIINEDLSTDIYGIVSLAEDCNNFHSYAITGGQSKIYEINFANNELELICELNISIGGGASIHEFLASYSINVDNSIEVYPTCNHTDGSITLEASGGNGLLEYSIDGINFQSSNSFENLAAEIYTFVIRDENDCRIDYEVDFTSSILKIENLDAQSTTCNTDNGSISIFTTGGSLPLEYSIDGINFQPSPIFQNLSAATYTTTVRDQAGCSKSKETTLLNSEQPELILLAAKDNTCAAINGKIEVEVINGTPPYRFSLGTQNPQTESLFEHLPPDDYQVNLVDDAGCLDSLKVNIEQEEPPNITDIITNPTTCGMVNGQASIEVSGGKDLSYSINQGPYQDSPVFKNIKAGSYRIDIKDENHCSDFAEFEIAPSEALSILSLEVQAATCGNEDGALHIEVEGNQGLTQFSINQQDFTTDLSYSDLAGGSYDLIAQDERGCEAAGSFSIAQIQCPFYIPNAFSPNGDGANDLFEIHPHPGFKGTFRSLNIFNRWGGLVYQIQNFDPRYDAWDGMVKGKMGAVEVYTYYLELSDEKGETRVIGGSVNLVR